MNRVVINNKIKNHTITLVMQLDNKELHSFKRCSKIDKAIWIKYHIANNTKIEDYEVIEE